MSCYFRQNADCKIIVPRHYESATGTILYDIQVRIAQVEWVVERRYRDFYQLNDKLVEETGISKNMLPPKKIVGNKNPKFLEQRRQLLEKYLMELLNFFDVQIPRCFAEFLDFVKYDIVFLLQDMSKYFKDQGATALSSRKDYSFSVLEVYAISERLNLPCPPSDVDLPGSFNFSHILDFCSQLHTIQISPTKDVSFGSDYNAVDVPIGRSNIIPKSLKYNLKAFRNLICVKICALPAENLIEADTLKNTLQKICVYNTTMTSINQILLCDSIHKTLKIDVPRSEDVALTRDSKLTKQTTPILWHNIKELEFKNNLLIEIDESIRTVPQLKILNLEQNRLQSIKNLAVLPHLQVLNLSINLITECINWHLEIGNLVTLNLARNKLNSLKGLRKLLSLVNLDVSCNLINSIDEVDHVANLPLLETFSLTGNPVASSVDYRPRVLARFHERACEIILDSERGTTSELDMALVLSALITSKKRNGQLC